MRKTLLTATAVICGAVAWAQPKLSADNIDEVLKAMTLEEKATLIAGGGWGSMSAGSMTASDVANVPGAAGSTQPIAVRGFALVTLLLNFVFTVPLSKSSGPKHHTCHAPYSVRESGSYFDAGIVISSPLSVRMPMSSNLVFLYITPFLTTTPFARAP